MKLPDNRVFEIVYACDGPRIHRETVRVESFDELADQEYRLGELCPTCQSQNISAYFTVDRIEVLRKTG